MSQLLNRLNGIFRRETIVGYFDFFNGQREYLDSILNEKNDRLSEYATHNFDAIRKTKYKKEDLLRTEFEIDIDKILHNALYNRYVDKTQVFSFYKNDDITRRALHVQLVARISKIIGQALNLNLDLIEAIALGHDIGHTPFGHKGESFLSDIYCEHKGKIFSHNVHSVRNLMFVTNSNLTLQTYDGILCHCGEKAFHEYRPNKINTFDEFMEMFEKCYIEKEYINTLRPSTLEGCVVRISDMLAYIGKDRQDASKANLCNMNKFDKNELLGKTNTSIINNLIINIVRNSIGKPYLKIDEEVYCELEKIKDENYEIIYNCKTVTEPYYNIIKPMMKKIYEKMRKDLIKKNYDSPIFKHHLNHKILGNCYRNSQRYIITDEDDIVVDYIASMTDDYFIDLFKIEFPDDSLSNEVEYVSYFE